jgi:hypothetical protein
MIPDASVLQRNMRGWRHVVAAALVAVACYLPAVRLAVGSIRGISEPYDLDQFRDIAGAQAAADGRYLADPFYAGETIWYNPLLPWTVAGVSRLRSVNVAKAFVQAGPFLNLLAPIGMFVMVTILFGPWPALLAVISLLYLAPHDDPSWANPSYSPWLFVSTFTSGLFYLAVTVTDVAIRRGTRAWWCSAGIALGVVFMAHTAPALILGLMVLANVMTARAGQTGGSRASRLLALVLCFGAAVIVSAPLLWSIVGRYGLHIVNPEPAAWRWPALDSVSLVLHRSVGVSALLPVIGLIVTARRAGYHVEARVMVAWVAAALGLFGYGYVARAPGTFLPSLPVPGFHFFFYLRAAGHVLVALGVWEILTTAAARVDRLASASIQALVASAAGVAAITAAGLGWHAYRDGRPFTAENGAARQMTFSQFESGLTSRLRGETPPGAVVLASPEYSLTEVAPSGRSVVAVPAAFSNPYVPFEPRTRDRDRLLAALMARDSRTFVALARARGVTHVVLGPVELFAFDQGGTFSAIEERSRQGRFALFAVRFSEDRPRTSHVE